MTTSDCGMELVKVYQAYSSNLKEKQLTLVQPSGKRARMLCSQPVPSTPDLLDVFHLKISSHPPWGLLAPTSLLAFPMAKLPPPQPVSLPPPLSHPQPSGVPLPPKLPLEKLARDVLQNRDCRLVAREPEVT